MVPLDLVVPASNFFKEDIVEKVKYSFKDTKGKEYIDCIECDRGSKGKDPDPCSAGYKHKKGEKGGCFLGALLEGLTF